MGRKIGAVILGLLAAGFVVALIERLGSAAFPPSAAFDPEAPDLSLVPLPAIVAVALAWVLGPLTGGWVTTLVGKPAGPVPALVVGAMFLAADIANLFLIPSPTWLWAVGLVAPLPAAWLGFAWARRGRPTA